MTAFRKMHGLGNDFAVFDGRMPGPAITPALAKAIADRRTGIGCDQVIVIGPSSEADARMRIFNADGTEVESCGNAARCVAQVLMAENGRDAATIATLGGPLACARGSDGLVSVDMGAPRFDWKDIPLGQPADTNAFIVSVDGVPYEAAAVSVGNPHCVLFVEHAESAPVAELGPKIEHHGLFPARINVEFVEVKSPRHLRMRVWERGAGITRACGTGACAAAVAAHRRGLAERKVEVVLDGGTLTIEWRDSDDHIVMTGPASEVYRGEIDLDAFEVRP